MVGLDSFGRREDETVAFRNGEYSYSISSVGKVLDDAKDHKLPLFIFFAFLTARILPSLRFVGPTEEVPKGLQGRAL